MNWYETLPLFGKRILIRKEVDKLSLLANQLRGFGAQVIESPTVTVTPVPQNELNFLIGRLHEYTDIIFPSRNSIEIFFNGLSASNIDFVGLDPIRFSAIGPGTAEAFQSAAGYKPDFAPSPTTQDALLSILGDPKDRKFLLLSAPNTRNFLTKELGDAIDVLPIYEYKLKDSIGLPELFKNKEVDMLSSHQVHLFAGLLTSYPDRATRLKICLDQHTSSQ